MKSIVLEMEITDRSGDNYRINIRGENQAADIWFNPREKKLEFSAADQLTDFLKKNEYQFRKILHHMRQDTFYQGFKLKFVIRDEKDVCSFNDKSKIVVLDRRNGKYESYCIDQGETKIYQIFTDGSYLADRNQGAFAIIIRDTLGEYFLHTKRTKSGNSNLMEMLAVMEALELIGEEEKIRIVTDSQYVRKGLTEWVFNWKLNNWRTANNEPVKNMKYWMELDLLTDNKYLELQWVKGHADHFENTMCHLYAKEEALGFGEGT